MSKLTAKLFDRSPLQHIIQGNLGAMLSLKEIIMAEVNIAQSFIAMYCKNCESKFL